VTVLFFCRGGFSHAKATLFGSASFAKQQIHQSFLLKLFASKSLWRPNPPILENPYYFMPMIEKSAMAFATPVVSSK
jgi:hypothetical protein